MGEALCFYISWKERKKYRKKKNMKNKFEHDRNDKGKKLVVVLSNVVLVTES